MSENTSALPGTKAAPLAHLSPAARRPRPPAPQPLPEPVSPVSTSEDAASSTPVLKLTERTPAADAAVAAPAEAVKRSRRPAAPAVADAGAGAADDLEHLRMIKARFSGESAPNKNLQLPESLADTLARRADEIGAPERYLVAAALTEWFERRQVDIVAGYTGRRRKL